MREEKGEKTREKAEESKNVVAVLCRPGPFDFVVCCFLCCFCYVCVVALLRLLLTFLVCGATRWTKRSRTEAYSPKKRLFPCFFFFFVFGFVFCFCFLIFLARSARGPRRIPKKAFFHYGDQY